MGGMSGLRLSVLDLSPVPSGSTPAEAIRHTLDLARHAEALGFHRFWVAEHHNAAGLACPSPEVMIAAIAARTTRIRVGSGGVMLPNHSALRVAEAFRVLEALHPGRIDLGVGRAPGTDKKTALALRRSPELLGYEGFPEQLDELLRLLTSDPDPAVPFNATKAIPTGVRPPALFVLGSGGEGASLAARHGLGFAFAHHFAPDDLVPSVSTYRAAFAPSAHAPSPRVIVATSVVCGEDDAHAARLAASGVLQWLRSGRGLRDLPLPSVEEASAYPYDADEATLRDASFSRLIHGGPGRVRDALLELADRANTDEIIVSSHIHDPVERRRSYERIATALSG
jgi:luciferase family oxidoreductase group 1